MSELSEERKAFKKMRDELEATAKGKWALVYKSDLIGTYDSFSDAATEAVSRFGRGPYLIRQIGAPETTLPASVVYAKLQDA